MTFFGSFEDFVAWMTGQKNKRPGPKYEIVRFPMPVLGICKEHGYHVLAQYEGGAEISHN